MKKKPYAVAILLASLLVGCGSSGDSSALPDEVFSSSSTDKYSSYIPKEDKPQTFICQKNDLVSETNETLNAMYRLFSYEENLAECEVNAQAWIDDFNHEDAPTLDPDQQQSALSYLNWVRKGVGLPEFKHNRALEKATQLHALYLKDVYDNFDKKNLTHYEDNESYPSDYYRGDTPTDRAKASGYEGKYGGDSISYYQTTSIGSIDTLLTAIYHRRAMLWNWIDEIGIGIGKGESEDFFHAEPHLMGIKDNDREAFLKAISPEIVCYPFPSEGLVAKVYDGGEIPNPLPDLQYWAGYNIPTGNPISVTFNDTKIESVEMLSFKIFKMENFNYETGEGDAIELNNTRLLDKESDPNHIFTALDFALFPLDILESKTLYKVEIHFIKKAKYSEEEEEETKSWFFQTRE